MASHCCQVKHDVNSVLASFQPGAFFFRQLAFFQSFGPTLLFLADFIQHVPQGLDGLLSLPKYYLHISLISVLQEGHLLSPCSMICFCDYLMSVASLDCKLHDSHQDSIFVYQVLPAQSTGSRRRRGLADIF